MTESDRDVERRLRRRAKQLTESGGKVRENRLRRAAKRQRYMLEKSKRRDPRAVDYDRWRIVDVDTYIVVAGAHPWAYSMTLDEVEAWLNDDNDEEAVDGD